MLIPFIPRKKEKGFTLIEVLVATFVFVIVISSTSQIFVSAFSAYRREKIIQDNLEHAQFAMNTLAKELRGASIIGSGGDVTSIKFYNYGETTCFIYSISSGTLSTKRSSAPDLAACASAPLTADTAVVQDVAGVFYVIPSASGSQGKVTLSLQVGVSSTHPANIQTTVSLRDYEVSGL